MIQIDMPMPKCCDECFALDDHGDYPFCLISKDQRGYTFNVREKRMPTCPLKAQKPRVMTPEEVVGNIVLERDVILWFEFHDGIKELNAKDIEYNDYLCDDDMPTLYEPNLKWRDNGYLDGVIVCEYNDVFRCWTSRPDNATREETPWE